MNWPLALRLYVCAKCPLQIRSSGVRVFCRSACSTCQNRVRLALSRSSRAKLQIVVFLGWSRVAKLPVTIHPKSVFCHKSWSVENLILPMHKSSKYISVPSNRSTLDDSLNSGSANVIPSGICISCKLRWLVGRSRVIFVTIKQSRLAWNPLILDYTVTLAIPSVCADISSKPVIGIDVAYFLRSSFSTQLVVIKQDCAPLKELDKFLACLWHRERWLQLLRESRVIPFQLQRDSRS